MPTTSFRILFSPWRLTVVLSLNGGGAKAHHFAYRVYDAPSTLVASGCSLPSQSMEMVAGGLNQAYTHQEAGDNETLDQNTAYIPVYTRA